LTGAKTIARRNAALLLRSARRTSVEMKMGKRRV
jgi:hypothetical protein